MSYSKLTLVFATALLTTAQAATINLHSGNGAVGSTDSQINFELGPASTDFPPFTPPDFTAASSGPAAFIITPHPFWMASLPADPSALWIGTNATAATDGNTGLYAISFTLLSAAASATLDLHYAVDNSLGSTNQGVYINGTALPGSIGGTYSSQNDFSSSTIGPLLHAGTNTLYIDAVNQGGPAGLIFSATITTQDAAPGADTAEPASVALVLLGTGAVVLGRLRIRRKTTPEQRQSNRPSVRELVHRLWQALADFPRPVKARFTPGVGIHSNAQSRGPLRKPESFGVAAISRSSSLTVTVTSRGLGHCDADTLQLFTGIHIDLGRCTALRWASKGRSAARRCISV